MDDKFADLIIQEIHTLGKNLSKLDRKVDLKTDKIYAANSESKKDNTADHKSITDKLDNHIDDHILCKEACDNKIKSSNDKIEGKMSISMFKWIIGGLTIGTIAVLIFVGGMTFDNKQNLFEHTTLHSPTPEITYQTQTVK